MSTSDRELRHNPLIPYWGAQPGRGYQTPRAQPSRGFHILEYPYSLEAAKQILLSIPSTGNTMVRRCTNCHRYITGSPVQALDHKDVPSGDRCTLPHHPLPCDWVGECGQVCSYVPPLLALPPAQEDLHTLGAAPPPVGPLVSVAASVTVDSLQMQIELTYLLIYFTHNG